MAISINMAFYIVELFPEEQCRKLKLNMDHYIRSQEKFGWLNSQFCIWFTDIEL